MKEKRENNLDISNDKKFDKLHTELFLKEDIDEIMNEIELDLDEVKEHILSTSIIYWREKLSKIYEISVDTLGVEWRSEEEEIIGEVFDSLIQDIIELQEFYIKKLDIEGDTKS